MIKKVVSPKTKKLYVNTATAKTISSYLLSKGIDAAQLESTIACSPDDLSAPDARLPISSYHALWELALSFTNDPTLGLKLAENPYNDEMGVVAHIFFNSPTLIAGLKQYERYYSLVNEGMHIEIETDSVLAKVKFINDVDIPYCNPDMEHTLGISVVRVKQNISDSLSLEAVHFQHSAPNDLSKYSNLFNCPVLFNQKCCCLIFKKEFLEYKLPKRSAYLYKILLKHIESLIKKVKPSPTFSQRVKSLIEQNLENDFVDAEHIAEKLFMSRHTLYRKLKTESIQFHDLVDSIREEKAYLYLDQDKHNLSEIAFLLGFSELSAFSRAFKRWTGKSPAKYIKSLKK